uniref:Integrase core domain-containing protein n=1 Tax=Lepisosteus oculatus TaxID=7918 RepID=W5MTG3_LEPOC
PIGRSFRHPHAIRRSVYNVQTPNQLWHFDGNFDGNHNLVRWRMVFHGCIGGFSQTIIYVPVRCLDNKRASNVLSLFITGLENFGLPSGVCCDHRMENIEVDSFMLDRRGLNRHCGITGVSVHNQHIE